MDAKILLLLAIALIASGCTSQNKTASDIQNGKEALEEASESDIYTVKYTDSGFEPSNLIVREGDKVEWLDRSNGEMKLSTSYSEDCNPEDGFASCSSVENFSYTFEEKGKLTYHNPENLDHTGVVRVQAREIY